MTISAEQIAIMKKHSWFHAIDLGNGVVSRGRFRADTPQNQTLHTVFDFLKDIDVNGMECLDIGATDGLVSFGLEKLGAKSVIATDRVQGAGFDVVKQLLNSNVERVQPVEISNILEVFSGKKFDLIICAGVIYHMLNPLSAIMACRALLKPGGLMIVETAMSWASDKAVLVLNSEEEEFPESSTYWAPTPKALIGMAKLCHFEVLGGRWQQDLGRGAVLGRATPHDTLVPNSTTVLKAMHEHILLDYPFQQQLSEADSISASKIKYAGAYKEENMDPSTYVPDFPLHAHMISEDTAYGQDDWKVVQLD